MKRKTIRNILVIGGLAGVAYYLLRREWIRAKQAMGNFRPLVESIRVTEDGQLSEIYTFSWNDEERTKWAHIAQLNSYGSLTSERLVEFEHYEDRMIVIDNANGDGGVPNLTTYLYDPYGMVKSISARYPGGKEKRWEVVLRGNELVELKREGEEEDAYYFTWEDGNLQQIDQPMKGETIKMTYYDHVENHLFPDLNMISQGLFTQLLTSYVMGTRSRNFMRSMVVKNNEGQEYYQFSYLCDNHNRPVQILMEKTETKNDATIRTSKEYDITYFV